MADQDGLQLIGWLLASSAATVMLVATALVYGSADGQLVDQRVPSPTEPAALLRPA